MTRDEVKKILLIIKYTYPNWHLGDEELSQAVDVWWKIFEHDDAELIERGLMEYIQLNSSGFAPCPAQIRHFQKDADLRKWAIESDERAKLEKKEEPKLIEAPKPPREIASAEFIDSLKHKVRGWV